MRERLSRGRLKLQHCYGDGEAPEKCEAFSIGTGAPTCTAQAPHRRLRSRGTTTAKWTAGGPFVHVQIILRSATE